MSTSRPTDLLSGASWVLVLNVLSGVAGFVALIWFARELGADAMGGFAQILVALDLVLAVFAFGFNQALIRHPADRALRDTAMVAVTAQLIAVGLVGTVLWWASGAQPEAGRLAVVLLMARGLGLYTTLLYAPLEAVLRYRPLAIARFVTTMVGLGVGVALILGGHGVAALAMRELCAAALLLGWTLLIVPERPGLRIERPALVTLWAYTRPLWQLNALERIAHRIDYAVVGTLLGREALGVYYTLRGAIDGLLGFALVPIQTVLFSHYCRLESRRPVIGLVRRVAWPALAATLAIAAAVAVLHLEPLVGRAFGEAFSPGGAMLPGLVAYFAAVVWFEHAKVLAMAELRHANMVYARLTQVAVAATAGPTLVWAIGLHGAGLATACGALALAVLGTLFLFRTGEPDSLDGPRPA
jgi:O-antigen/teichoic acid export membrane protein